MNECFYTKGHQRGPDPELLRAKIVNHTSVLRTGHQRGAWGHQAARKYLMSSLQACSIKTSFLMQILL